VFAVTGEEQEKAADEETAVLLKRFPRNPDVQKARAEFESAQEVEERFHRDFDGVDFTQSIFSTRFPTHVKQLFPELFPAASRTLGDGDRAVSGTDTW
jgi:hypothetical protein